MNMNPERFTTYKSLSPVLTTQTTAGYRSNGNFGFEEGIYIGYRHLAENRTESSRIGEAT